MQNIYESSTAENGGIISILQIHGLVYVFADSSISCTFLACYVSMSVAWVTRWVITDPAYSLKSQVQSITG